MRIIFDKNYQLSFSQNDNPLQLQAQKALFDTIHMSKQEIPVTQ